MYSLNTIKNLNKNATYVVCIGRNISNSKNELHQTEWANFIRQTYRAIENFTCEIYNHGTIKGEYQGTPEDSYIITFAMLQGHEFELKGQFSELAQKYKQDSIALIKGKTIFIK